MTLQTNRFTPEQRAELERRRGKPPVVSAFSATGNIGSSPLSVPPGAQGQTTYKPTAAEVEAHQKRVMEMQQARFNEAVRGLCCGR